MASKKDISSPRKGMNKEVHESELGKTEYSFALNANFTDENGNGQILLQNEPSNILCTGFITGYKIIGFKYDVTSEKTFFFLTNPTTGAGQIGYINNSSTFSTLQQLEDNCECNVKAILETPLELAEIGTYCTYNTIVTDTCEILGSEWVGAFNFSIHHPIHEDDIQIKHERLGTTIYWTDGYNSPRYIQLTADGTTTLPHYFLQPDTGCTGNPASKCITAEDLLVFKPFNKPCLSVDTIVNGGTLKAGAYEVLVAYCNAAGSLMSQYFSMTNPILIFDKNNNILDQTNLDYVTNQGIRLLLGDIDANYEFFKISVIYHSGLDAATSYYDYNVYPTDTDAITITSLVGKPYIGNPNVKGSALKTILSSRPSIKVTKGMTNANGYLMQYGIEEQREINLQPVVNLMGAFARWATVQAKEKLYEDGANAAKYKGYMRDEVYPFGIRFTLDGGFETSLFPLVPRPAVGAEKDIVVTEGVGANDNVNSVLAYNPNCSADERIYKWQYENTIDIESIKDSTCSETSTSIATIPSVRETEFTCLVDSVPLLITAVDAVISYTDDTDIVTYVNEYMNDLRTYAGADLGKLSIKDAILAAEADALMVCTPETERLDCGVLTLIPTSTDPNKTHAVALSADVTAPGDITNELAAPSAYTRVKSPGACGHLMLDYATGEYARDVDISNATTGTVYQRNPTNNKKYKSAIELPIWSTGVSDYPRHLVNMISLVEGDLKTTIGATSFPLSGYSDKLHQNVTWYKVTFGSKDELIAEMGTILCDQDDANSGSSLRVSFYKVSGTTLTQVGSSILISDLNTYSDATHFYELSKVDFTGEVVYIAIDSALGLTGISKDFVEINSFVTEGTTLTVRFATLGGSYLNYSIDCLTSKVETLDSFVAKYATAIYTETGGKVVVSHNGSGVLEAYYPTGSLEPRTALDYAGGFWTTDRLEKPIYSLKPPCGCFNLFKRDVSTLKTFTFHNLKFGKLQTYVTNCTFNIPVLNNCNIIPHKNGKFAYWESVETYPCNHELYNSSTLTINQTDLSDLTLAEVTDFEDYYTSGIVSGVYTLNTEANLTDKPIRHYKFPDNKVIPFMSTSEENAGDFKDSLIYPIGFSLKPSVINTFLDIALSNGLITAEERSKITHYEIYKGDTRIDRSVIAKGLLFDMALETQGDGSLYSNYPLNTLGADKFNGNTLTSSSNNNFTFHSPDTHFYKPSLPREMAIDGYVFGKSRMYYDTVDKHPTYVVLAQGSFTLATALGAAEATLEVLAKTGEWLTTGAAGGYSSIGAVIVAGASITNYTIGQVFKAGQYRLQWIQTLYDLGTPTNHAYYQAAVGHYNYFLPNSVPNSTLRGLSISHYLKEGLWTVADEYIGASLKVNNRDREDSVMLSISDAALGVQYPATYTNYDNASTNSALATRRGYPGKGKSSELLGNAASPYVALKQYNPSQHGSIGSIDWKSTGFCGRTDDFSDDCKIVLGGDIFISRFSVKRKFPFFSTTAIGLAPLTPYMYSHYWNINPAYNGPYRYFLNYKMVDESTDSVGIDNLFFPSQRSEYKLQYEQTGTHLYVNPEAKFYLYSYGFPHFLVESEYNCNYRYAGREMSENFYPNTGDILTYTQETKVSIREHERFNYNTVYSTKQSQTLVRTLPSNFKQEDYDKFAISNNGLIISELDNSENNSLIDPWLIYQGSNSYVFPTEFGVLTDMSAIESGNVVARFTNGLTMFDSEAKQGSLITQIAGQSKSFNKTELGYAGSQNKAMVSCEFGHYWVDAKRGRVFELKPGGQGLADITTGISKWFKDNLPFNILKALPTAPIDNSYNGVGITMTWDDNMKRLFLTKKDYKLKNIPINLQWNDELGYYYEGDGITPVSLDDNDYFHDCSWTIAYSPLTQSWISYYSFKPDYYVSYNGYFSSGINTSVAGSATGIWMHLPFLSSYQVFYGTRYPFTIEYAVPSKYSNSVMEAVEYMLDVRKYYDKYDYADIYGIGFNQAVVYNNQQNSGLLNLVHQKENNIKQQLDYPKHNATNIDILQSCINNKWSFNYLYNLIKSDKSGLPIWQFDEPKVIKTIDSKLLDYRPTFKDRLRGNYFKVQLSNTLESRYKFIFMYGIDERNYYE